MDVHPLGDLADGCPFDALCDNHLVEIFKNFRFARLGCLGFSHGGSESVLVVN